MRQQATNLSVGLHDYFEKKIYIKSDSWPELKSDSLFKKIEKDTTRLRYQKVFQEENRMQTILPFMPQTHQKDLIRIITATFRQKENLLISSPFRTGTTHCLLSSLISCINEERQDPDSDGYEMPSRIIYVASTVKRLESVASSLRNLVYKPSVGVILPKEMSCRRHPDKRDIEVRLKNK
jgi:hypothetical protein